MEYTTIVHHRSDEFDKIINHMIKELGWKLQGGVSITVDTQMNRVYYCQALIREG